jgi:hypothetical protein
MKIALFDPYGGKFTDGMQKWWTEHGYEVEYSRYYNPEIALRSDILWFETCDNNLASATSPGNAILDDAANFSPWDLHDMDLTGKKIIVRPIDIEVWQGHAQASKWDLVDDVIFIAPHIRELVNEYELPHRREDLRIHTIPCAIDLDKFTYKEREPGFEIAVISERWITKGTSEILQIALKLKQIDPRYKITWLGQRSDYQWEHSYRDEFVAHHKLNLEFVNIVDNIDEFLEDKNYLLHASHKEGFSYATAEAMAKGIKPVIHRFFGADDLWPGITWDSIDEAVAMITEGKYDSASYRQYLTDHEYTLDLMMKRIDKIIKGE